MIDTSSTWTTFINQVIFYGGVQPGANEPLGNPPANTWDDLHNWDNENWKIRSLLDEIPKRKINRSSIVSWPNNLLWRDNDSKEGRENNGRLYGKQIDTYCIPSSDLNPCELYLKSCIPHDHLSDGQSIAKFEGALDASLYTAVTTTSPIPQGNSSNDEYKSYLELYGLDILRSSTAAIDAFIINDSNNITFILYNGVTI